MVRLDLCLDHNRGVVSVCSTERGGGGDPSLWIRRDAERSGWVCLSLIRRGERLGGGGCVPG